MAIDKSGGDVDAHFQLARIAREQGRLEDAAQHLEIVAKLDDKHSLSEVWREIAATHLALAAAASGTGAKDAPAHMAAAQSALEKFVNRREYDPEGLYWLGETFQRLNHDAEAKEYFKRSVEAAKTMPSNRRGETRKWGKLSAARL